MDSRRKIRLFVQLMKNRA